MYNGQQIVQYEPVFPVSV